MIDKDLEATSYWDDQENPNKWKVSKIRGFSAPPNFVEGDTEWKPVLEQYRPEAPLVYIRKEVPYTDVRITVQGNKYGSEYSIVFPVPELAQGLLGAPALIRLSASIHTSNAGLDDTKDGGLLIDLGEAFQNAIILPLVRTYRTKYFLKYVAFIGANIGKILPTTKVRLSFRPFWQIYPSRGGDAQIHAEFNCTPSLIDLKEGGSPFTDDEFDQFCCENEIRRTVDDIREKYFPTQSR